eukprot:8773786-Pyramimonas_sp.AAC.1
MRSCYFGRGFDLSGRLPGGSHLLAVATPNPWKRARRAAWGPADRTERELDRQGRGSQKAEWRDNKIACTTAR